MEEIKLNLNDEDSSQVQKKEISPFKKKLIISGVIAMFIIIILIIILIAVKDKPSRNFQESLGEISCEYMIEDTSKNIILLGNDFKKENNDFEIYINKKRVKYSKEYKPDGLGKLEVKFQLYSKINMDFMFKDISTLTSVIMISTSNLDITSMVSTFENCTNLYELAIRGFKTDKIVSMKKFLYKASPTILNLNSFSTANVEDMSYMFSEMNLLKMDFKNFDTSKAKNMSHMFYKNNDIYNLDLTHFNTSFMASWAIKR